MTAWKITRTDEKSITLRSGEGASVPAAWGQAATAVLEELATGEQGPSGERAVTVGVASALIVAGRTDAGELDLAATRSAVQQMVFAVASELILGELLG